MKKNYAQYEKSISNKLFFLFGTRKIRNGKADKVFCQNCYHSNDIQCLYDIMAAQGEKMDTKYPCGKAYIIYKESRSNKK